MEFISTTSRNLSSKGKIGQERNHQQQYLGSWGVDKWEVTAYAEMGQPIF